jgi:hypothetical protein
MNHKKILLDRLLLVGPRQWAQASSRHLLAAGAAATQATEHVVDQPDAEAGDDGGFPAAHRQVGRSDVSHQLQGNCRDEHLQAEDHDEADAQGADADDRGQKTDQEAEANEDHATGDALGPEAAVNGNTRNDGREGVGEEESQDDDTSDEFHDVLSR